MRLTGYFLIGLAGLLVLYAGLNYLIYDVTSVERAGTLNAGASSGNYWYALIPAVGAAAVGVWLALSRDKGYHETYDLTRQQTGPTMTP
jgi:H+/Cl- antiporter ClcA